MTRGYRGDRCGFNGVESWDYVVGWIMERRVKFVFRHGDFGVIAGSCTIDFLLEI